MEENSDAAPFNEHRRKALQSVFRLHLHRKEVRRPQFSRNGHQALIEWSRLRKNYLHSKELKWTNEYIANLSGLSLTTVSRFLSGDLEDIKLSTAAAIVRVLVNGTWGQYPCAMAAGEDDIDKDHLVEQLNAEKAKTEYLKKQVEFKEKQMLEKDQTIKENYQLIKQRMRITAVLGTLLGIAVLVIITGLVIDLAVPGVGFFWR